MPIERARLPGPRMKLLPARTLLNSVEALAQRATGDAQAVDRARVWLDQVAPAQFDRVKTQVVRNLVKVNLDCVARLRGSMSALGTTGRLVGKQAHALKLICRQGIGDGLKSAGI